MKRSGGDLEQHSHQGHQQRQHHDRIFRISSRTQRERVRDIAEVGRSGDSVEQRETIGKHRRRERAQQKILERGLVGALIAAKEAGQNVGGDRHQFDADEDQHQVVSGGHAHHADDGKEQERVEFAVVLAFDLEVLDRNQNGDRRAHQEQVEEVHGKRIEHQAAEKAAQGLAAQRQHALNSPRVAGCARKAKQCGDSAELFQPRGQEQIQTENDEGKQRQHEYWRAQTVVLRRKWRKRRNHECCQSHGLIVPLSVPLRTVPAWLSAAWWRPNNSRVAPVDPARCTPADG